MLTIFLFIIILQSFATASKPNCSNVSSSFKPGNIFVVSVSSMWSQYGLPTFNTGAFYQHLTLLSRIWRHGKQDSYEIGFLSFDVCENKTLLTEVISSLLLEKSYLVSEKTPVADQKCICLESSQSILAVFGYMPNDMLKLAADLLLPAKIPFFAVKNEPMFFDTENSNPYFLPSSDITNEGKAFSLFFKKFRWKRINLLCLSCLNDNLSLFFERLWKHLTTTTEDNLCVTYERDNETNIEKFLQKLQRENKTGVLVVSGFNKLGYFSYSSPQFELMERFYLNNVTGKLIVLHEYSDSWPFILHKLSRNLVHGLFTIKNSIFNLGITNQYDLFALDTDVKNDEWVKKFRQFHTESQQDQGQWINADQYKIFVNDLDTIIMRTIIYFNTERDLEKVKDKLANVLQRNIRFFNQNTTAIPYNSFNFDTKQQKVFTADQIPDADELSWPNYQSRAPIIKCEKRICDPGLENMFGDLNANETVWQMERGWSCKKCKGNTIKSGFGIEPCVPCRDLYIANSEKTNCYYPFVKEYMHSFGHGVIVSICVAAVGFFWTIFVMTVLFKYRKTPCARSSDLFMSTLQLLSLLLFFAVYPYLMIAYPSKPMCLSQSYFMGITLTLAITITLSKTQKLLFAFHARQKLSKKMIIITTATEILIIGIFMSTDILLHIVMFMQHEVVIEEKIYSRQYRHYVYCNTDILLQIQVCFILLLTIICNIQGFRARNLPSNYNETKFILYGTLMLNLCLVIMFPINFSQQNPVLKLTSNLIMITAGMTLFVVILYANKMYIMIFRQDLNTTAVFRKKLMENTQKQVAKQAEKRERKNLQH